MLRPLRIVRRSLVPSWLRHIDRRAVGYLKTRTRPLRCELLEARHLLTITVDTLVDEADGSIVDGDISLRDVIAAAATGETVDFHSSLDGGTILLTLGEVAITKALTLDASALPAGITIDASGNDPTPLSNNGDGSRIIHIDDGDDNSVLEVEISGVTLTGGDVNGVGGAISTRENLTVTSSTISGNSGFVFGGGIFAQGAVTVTSSTISGNLARGDGVGLGGGGIFAYGAVTVTSSIISGNSAPLGSGSGIYGDAAVTVTASTISGNSARYSGGGVFAHGDLTVTSSTISNNRATRYGEGGGIAASRDVTVTSSTISGNLALLGGSGGGIRAGGAVMVTFSTISGNSAFGNQDYTGVGDGGGILAGGAVTVTFSTIAGNSAGYGSFFGQGGGIWAYDDPVTIENSIVVGNSDSGTAPDLRPGTGTLNVNFSLIGDNTGTTLDEAPVDMPDANGNLIGGPINGITDPMLATLTNNGGPTQTHALLPGSPANNAGDAALAPPPDFDQRGAPFLRVAQGRIDIGAFEVQTLGDMDFDGDLDLDDIGDFVLGLRNASAYEAQYGVPPSANGDTDGDGDFDFDDIPGFVERLLSGEVQTRPESTVVTADVPAADMSDAMSARCALFAQMFWDECFGRETPGTQDSSSPNPWLFYTSLGRIHRRCPP